MAKPGKAEKWAARSERLSAALRENLKKRRQQAKQRQLARHGAAGAAHEETAAPEHELTAPGPDFRRNRDGN